MAFIRYGLLSGKYQDGQMAENLHLIVEFDMFHCLLAGSAALVNAVNSRVAGLPIDFLPWLEVLR